MPIVWQIQARQDPGLDLFPCVLGQEYSSIPKLRFDPVESLTPTSNSIAIDAQNIDVRHPIVEFNDFRNTL